MDDLSSAWRRIDSPEPPRSDDSAWMLASPDIAEPLEKLGLSEKPIVPPAGKVVAPGKRGRPKGSRSKAALLRLAREAQEPPRPKRRPGRPKGS